MSEKESKHEEPRPDFIEKWAEIANGKLKIKCYYFPTTQNLNVKISKIVEIRIRKQSKRRTKAWGARNSTTWWACDIERNTRANQEHFYNVKVDVGDIFKKGFTVKDIDLFLLGIRKWSQIENIVYE